MGGRAGFQAAQDGKFVAALESRARDINTLSADSLLQKSGLVAHWDEALRAAKGGDATAAMLLAQAYHNGIGIPKDAEEARFWADRAVKGGNARAMIVLGIAAAARGDHAGAMEWYRRSADAGVALAMTSIGVIYLEGNNAVAKDPAQALAWMRVRPTPVHCRG